MAAYKTILVPVSDARTGGPALDAALALATRFAAHVTALHVRTDPTAAVPLVGEGMSGAMVDEMMSVAETEASKRAVAARALFEATANRLGVPEGGSPPLDTASAVWLDVTGREEEMVAWHGRLSDLVVIGRPDPEDELPSLMTLNAALMESGKPMLLVPPTPTATLGTATLGHRAAIAWNGSAEAGRAVSAALPLLATAEAVVILSVSEDDRTSGATAGELAAYLAWHGVKADCHVLRTPGSHAGEELLNQAAAHHCDLLVMGAYTHSRLRQMILGGVTRHVLHHARVTCLMSH